MASSFFGRLESPVVFQLTWEQSLDMYGPRVWPGPGSSRAGGAAADVGGKCRVSARKNRRRPWLIIVSSFCLHHRDAEAGLDAETPFRAAER